MKNETVRLCMLEAARFSQIPVKAFQTYCFRSRRSRTRKFEIYFSFILCILFSFSAALYSPGSLYAAAGDELYQQGFDAWSTRNYDNAITLFESYIAQYPKGGYRNDAELRLADSYFQRGNFVNMADSQKGREHLSYILQQGSSAPNYKEASLHYAFALSSLMNFAEAKPRLEEYIRTYPNDSSLQNAYYYLGICESHLGNYPAAINNFTTCLERFPQGKLKQECRLDQAVAIGKSGRYAEADKLLTEMIAEPGYNQVPKAWLQRAHLQINQRNYDSALNILNSFIQTYQNVPNAQNFIIEAYQYQAYCYNMLGQYDKALQVAEQLERLNQVSPEAALLKVKSLVYLGRFDEADLILNQLKTTKFGEYASDILTYYGAMVSLARGNWNNAIDTMNRLLVVQPDPQNSKAVTFGYFNSSSQKSNKLLPIDFLGAGGVLICAYASRWSATKQYPDDNEKQEAIYNALNIYAQKQTGSSFEPIMEKIDAERKRALVQPVSPIRGTMLTEGTQMLSPLRPQQTETIPTFSGQSVTVRPAPPSSSDSLSLGGGLPSSGTSVPPGSFLGSRSVSGTGTSVPGATSPVSGIANRTDGFGRPLPSTGSTASPGSSSGKVSTSMASTVLNRAGECYENKDYERAERMLVTLLTKSSTFWDDCPTVAPQIVLLYSKVLRDEKKYLDAKRAWEELAKQVPNSPQAAEANYFLGYYYDSLMARDKAIESFEKVVNTSVNSEYRDAACYYLGMNEWERRNTARAEDYFRTVYRNFSGGDYAGHAAWAIAKIEFDAMNYTEAEKIVNNELSRNPDEMIVDWLLFLKGEIALRFGDYEKARIAFNLIVNQFPDSPKQAEARGRLAMMTENKNRAPKEF